MKSRSVRRARRDPALPPWKWRPLNIMNFPQAFRDAIPATKSSRDVLSDGPACFDVDQHRRNRNRYLTFSIASVIPVSHFSVAS